MKTIITILAALALGAGSLKAKEYSFKDFAADFPKQPTVTQYNSDISYKLITQDGKLAWNVSVYDDSRVTYTIDKIKAKVIADAQYNNSTIGIIRDLSIQGYPALYITSTGKTEGGRTYVVATLHVFAYPVRYAARFFVFGSTTAYDFIEARDKFLESFTVLGPRNPNTAEQLAKDHYAAGWKDAPASLAQPEVRRALPVATVLDNRPRLKE